MHCKRRLGPQVLDAMKMKTHIAFTALLGALLAAPAAQAAVSSTPSSGLGGALSSDDTANLFDAHNSTGRLSIGGNFFSGRASGNDAVVTSYYNEGTAIADADHSAELEGDQRVYALLVDGRYDFNYDVGGLHPYLSGGMGMATYGDAAASEGAMAMQPGDMVPLFRMGGGVTYRLGEQWDLSLDYKAGFSPGGDQIFTSRSQQSIDMQTLNVGMHFAF